MIVRLLPILGITFIDILGFSILIPLLPLFVKHFGAPDVAVGGLFAAFAVCQFIGGPFWGNVSDRVGRKTVLIVSQIGSTIGWTMLAFAPSISIVVLARIIEGFSGGNLSITQAYVSDLVEPEKRGRAFSYIGASFSAGLIFGPLFGGTLVGRFGFAVPFLLAAALQVVTLVLTIFILPESRKVEADERPAGFADVVQSLTNVRVAPVMWQKFVFSLGLYGWFSAFTLIMQRQFGFTASTMSYAFALFGVVSVISQLGIVGRVTDAIADRRASNLGFALMLVAFAFAPFSRGIGGAAAMLLFFALGLSLCNATIPSLLSKLAPENLRGTVLGAGSSLESLSGIVMPVLSTYTLQTSGVLATASISFGFVALALAMGLILQARAPQTA